MLILAIAFFLALGYVFNFTAIVVRVGASQEINILAFMLGYAIVYLLCWLAILFFANKRSSKKLLNLCCIYWALTSTCFVLFSFATFFNLFGFLLFIPLAGFDALSFYLRNGYLYTQDMNIALMISIVVSLLCLIVRLKRTK